MLEVTPASVHFNDVCPHQTYTSPVVIKNPFPSNIELQLKCSSLKYSLSTNKVVIPPLQAVQVLVQLELHSVPHRNYSSSDWLLIRSINLYQKVPLSFSVLRDNSYSTREVSRPHPPTMRAATSGVEVKDDSRVEGLEAIIRELESRHPNMAELVRLKVEEECRVFEERSEEILRLLRRKDEQIQLLERELREAATEQPAGGQTDILGEQLRAAEAETARERAEHEETLQVLEELQRTYELLRREKKALESHSKAMEEKIADQEECIARLSAQLEGGERGASTEVMLKNTDSDEGRTQRIQKDLEDYRQKYAMIISLLF